MVRAVLSRGAVSDALVQVKHEIVHIHVIHKLSTPREAASHRRRPRQRHDWAPGRWHRLLTVSTGRAACADADDLQRRIEHPTDLNGYQHCHTT